MARRSPTPEGYPLPPIPQIIHQIWLPNWLQVPAAIRHTRAEWCRLNPTWSYQFWGIREISYLVDRKYPELWKIWSKLANERVIKMADFARLVVLHRMGGLYVDMDLLPVMPIIQKRGVKGKIVVSTEWTVYDNEDRFCNGFMGSVAGEKIWLDLLHGCEERLHGPVLDFLGPPVITEALKPLRPHILPWRHVLSVEAEKLAITRNLENRSWGEHLPGKKWYCC